jgi:hypothetical protein
VFYAAILTLWLVALPGFINISHVPGNVNVMSVVIAAALSLLILCSVEAILVAQCLSEVQTAKCEITVPVCTGVLTPVSRIRGYCPHLLKFQLHIKGTVLYF